MLSSFFFAGIYLYPVGSKPTGTVALGSNRVPDRPFSPTSETDCIRPFGIASGDCIAGRRDASAPDARLRDAGYIRLHRAIALRGTSPFRATGRGA